MGYSNESFIIASALLLASLLLPVRLIAMKFNADPISKRYKPSSSEYKAYLEFRNSRRFATALLVSLLVVLSLTIYVYRGVEVLMRANTPRAHDVLILAPIFAVSALTVALVVTYNMLLKDGPQHGPK